MYWVLTNKKGNIRKWKHFRLWKRKLLRFKNSMTHPSDLLKSTGDAGLHLPEDVVLHTTTEDVSCPSGGQPLVFQERALALKPPWNSSWRCCPDNTLRHVTICHFNCCTLAGPQFIGVQREAPHPLGLTHRPMIYHCKVGSATTPASKVKNSIGPSNV